MGLTLAFSAVVILLGLTRGDGSGGAPRENLMGRRAAASTAAPQPPPVARRNPGDPSLPGVNVHVNDQGGYLFSYPDHWELSIAGPVEELTNPTRDVVMSFDLAPGGSLRRASEQVVAALSARYSDLQVVSDGLEPTEQGQPSSVLGATGTDEHGALIRLMVITVRGPDQNRSIVVRFSPGSDPLRVLPDIQQIVGSFRTSVEM